MRRLAGWLLKVAAVVVIALGVAMSTVHWAWTVLGLAGGLALMVAGASLSPGSGTGAFFARDLMEIDPASLRHMRPPGGNLTDPFEGPDSDRFIGR